MYRNEHTFAQTNIRSCIQYTILNFLNFLNIQTWFNLSNFLSRLNCQTIQSCIQYTNIRSRTYVRTLRHNDSRKWLQRCNLQRLRKSCIKELRRSCINAPQKSCVCLKRKGAAFHPLKVFKELQKAAFCFCAKEIWQKNSSF